MQQRHKNCILDKSLRTNVNVALFFSLIRQWRKHPTYCYLEGQAHLFVFVLNKWRFLSYNSTRTDRGTIPALRLSTTFRPSWGIATSKRFKLLYQNRVRNEHGRFHICVSLVRIKSENNWEEKLAEPFIFHEEQIWNMPGGLVMSPVFSLHRHDFPPVLFCWTERRQTKHFLETGAPYRYTAASATESEGLYSIWVSSLSKFFLSELSHTLRGNRYPLRLIE